ADKAASQDTTELKMVCIPHGQGQIFHYPVPVEVASPTDMLWAYQTVVHDVFERKTMRFEHLQSGVLIRRVEFAEHVLYLMLNEAGSDWNFKKNILRLVEAEKADAMTLLPGQVAVSFRSE